MKKPKQVRLAIPHHETRAPVFATVVEWHGVWAITPHLEKARGGRSTFASQKFQLTHGPTGCKVPQPFHRLELVQHLARRLDDKFGQFAAGAPFGDVKMRERPRGEELADEVRAFVDGVTAGRILPEST